MSSSSRGGMSEKGVRYLGLLDQALCNGSWAEIMELARKTDKHAPERKCFTLTARAEAQIASASHRPTSASSSATSSIHGLGELLPNLTAAINETRYPEDAYAARVCSAAIHWLREDAEKALGALGDSDPPARGDGGQVAPLGWLEVCDVKSRLIRVAALESAGKEDDARQLYMEACRRTPGSRTLELRRWTERLIARACMAMSRNVSDPTAASLSESLQCFHAWSDFWQRAPSSSPPSSSFSYLDIPRRQVWDAYYELVSMILRYNLMYNPSSTSPSDLLTTPTNDRSDEQYTVARQKQHLELRRVEATYESLLLSETQFPKASQTNTEVEEWTRQVMANWKIFCSWLEADLGNGGQQAVSRGVLDILYRAATKTFHSTAVLRQLFAVHASLGEFDLAIHAFNSYVELVNKAKARAEKTGMHELGFDSDDSVVLTAAEVVRVLCRYGDHDQGEKAMGVIKTIEAWIGPEKLDVMRGVNGTNEDHQVGENGVLNYPDKKQLQSTTLAAAHRAIGTAKGHWARLTYETDTRSTLQVEALRNLRLAQIHDEGNVETAFALALLLAETRDVWAATEVIKAAIALSAANEAEEDEDEDAVSEDVSRERQLVPLWHLLALCLSAKDDYEQAARICETAFEQFGESTTLFGDDTTRVSSESEKVSSRSSRGIVDQMESFEKEGLVQVKISQLALVELMEGAEAAVDVSHELLALYGRLFGNLELLKPIAKAPPTATSAAPSKLGGTLRSLAGSIRPRSARASVEKDTYRNASIGPGPEPRTSTPTASQRGPANGSAIGVPISITVTNEDGMAAEKPQHHHFPFKLRGQHGDWREHGNLRTAQSNSSMREKRSTKLGEKASAPRNATADARQVSSSNLPTESQAEKAEARDEPSSPEQPLGEMKHNAPHDAWPPPPGHKDQPPRQDVRLPAPHPTSPAPSQPRLPSAQDRQQKISLLVKIWLFIAGLYIRADLFDDSGGAIDEAYKLVESFEMEVGAEHANARRLFEKGCAGGKSVDELWADVWAARGDLASARSQPFVAMRAYEQALSYFPDHPEGIVGLCNLLMDIYEEKIPAEEPRPLLQSATSSSGSSSTIPPPPPPRPPFVSKSSSSSKANIEPPKQSAHQDPTPAELNRLAARDRAYMLLATLTRLGSGWDNSEAWYTLARSHELSKQVGKAKQALWWVVELEEYRPMRPWREVSPGGLTL